MRGLMDAFITAFSVIFALIVVAVCYVGVLLLALALYVVVILFYIFIVLAPVGIIALFCYLVYRLLF